MISPWSRRGAVALGIYDHTSVLKMIESRWNLPPLTVRDASARNLAEVLDFRSTNLSAPQFTVPTGPFGVPAPTTAVADGDRWLELAAVAAANGFTLPAK